MLKVDLHVHSLFSLCGLHTILELLNHARQIGLEGIAINDHGPALGGRLNDVFFERFICPFKQLRLFKGIECNILDDLGSIDLPIKLLSHIDLVLLGIHPNTPKGLSKDYYTSLLIAAMEKNPSIDIITHPNDSAFPVDYVTLARAAKKRGVALELNNSRILYSRSTIDDTIGLILACKLEQCNIAVCSDTHAIHELAGDDSVRVLLEKSCFPEDLIVTRTSVDAFSFIEGRLKNKREKSFI